MESKNDGFIITNTLNEMNNWRKYKTINPKRCEIDNVGNNILIFIIEKGLLSLKKSNSGQKLIIIIFLFILFVGQRFRRVFV